MTRRIGTYSVYRALNCYESSGISHPLLLVDPSAEFDFGPGKLTAAGHRAVLRAGRRGSSISVLAIPTLTNLPWPVSTAAATLLLYLSIYDWTKAVVIAGILVAIAVANGLVATWVNRRADMLADALRKAEVPLPSEYRRPKQGAQDDLPGVVEAGEQRNAIRDAVKSLRNMVEVMRQTAVLNNQGRRFVPRRERNALYGRADLLLYSMARALHEDSPEIASALAVQMQKLKDEIVEAMIPSAKERVAVNIPAPSRTILELAREAGVGSEPDNPVEIVSGPPGFRQPPWGDTRTGDTR